MTIKIKLGGGDCAIIIRKNGLPELVVPEMNASADVPEHVLAATNLFMQLENRKALADEVIASGREGVALQ